MKKVKLLLLAFTIMFSILPLSSCGEELYEIYEYRAMPAANEPYIEEYQHWRYDTYQFNTPEEEIDITFNGVTYRGIYDSESKPTLYIEYGVEALNHYHIYYDDNCVGNVDINDRSGNIQKIRFAVDFEAVYNATVLSTEERLKIADSLAGQYIDIDDYHFSSCQSATHKVKYDSDENINLYNYTYYKNVNGKQCEYDKVIIEMYQDGTLKSVELKELGSIDKNAVLHYDHEILLNTILEKLKGTERYIEYSNGEFDFAINSSDIAYYVFDDGEIGMYIDMGIAIMPYDSKIPVKHDTLMYIIKTNQ